MEAQLQAQIAFHLTGNRSGTRLGAIDSPKLEPALFAGYRDLAALRYDFPAVLIDGRVDGYAEPLSAIIDDVMSEVSGGSAADRVSQHVLRLESTMRLIAAEGFRGQLTELWAAANERLVASDPAVSDSVTLARAALAIDGAVADCDERLPSRLLTHAWEVTRDRRGERAGASITRLVLRLTDILKADFQNSAEGKSAENLKSSFGTGPMDAFDFESMSRILTRSAQSAQLSASRRERIEGLLATLQSQRFFRTSLTHDDCYGFTFDDCATALKAYQERFPEAIELSRAVAVGELEVAGEYDEDKHDQLFESFGSDGLESNDLAMFPNYLVRLNADELEAHEREQLFDILSADLPFKILVQSDDVIEPAAVGDGHLAFAMHSRGLASTAVGLTGVFVLQAPSSALMDVRESIEHGLDFLGPALFSVFSGASPAAAGTSPYLVAAAALESRAFPVFVYDPSTGRDWAHRFSLDGNPQPEADWPVHTLEYQDASCQSVADEVPFTLIDFVAGDPRYAEHFASVPVEEWTDAMVPVDDIVRIEGRTRIERVPSLLLVDVDDVMHRVIVDEKLVREARRCLSMWHSLQELGGIHNSYAERALAEAPPVVVVRESPVGQPAQQVPAADSVVAEPVDAESVDDSGAIELERSPDEPYIETARCSTCNECTLINGTMFAYNDNQQAFIADLKAGTYAQLVEAAESCQVSVIHPGKPWDPSEPGLEELLKRAEPFA
jgi:ferredoxin